MAEHCTPDQIFESSSRSFSVGSKIGYHHHQRCRPAFPLDAREISGDSQEGRAKKMAAGLLHAARGGVEVCLSGSAGFLQHFVQRMCKLLGPWLIIDSSAVVL